MPFARQQTKSFHQGARYCANRTVILRQKRENRNISEGIPFLFLKIVQWIGLLHLISYWNNRFFHANEKHYSGIPVALGESLIIACDRL